MNQPYRESAVAANAQQSETTTTSDSAASAVVNAVNAANEVVCRQCGTRNVADARFCEECGYQLDQPPLISTHPFREASEAGIAEPAPPLAATEPPPAVTPTSPALEPLTPAAQRHLHLSAAGLTDNGAMREYNQDDFVIVMVEAGRAAKLLPQVFVVADGMGGTVGGEVASAITRSMIVKWAAERAAEAVSGSTGALASPGQQFAEQVQQVSAEIYRRAHEDGTDMGTTVTGAVVLGDTAYIANVGDSRTYLIRAGTITRLTKDHSLVERLIDAGAMDPDERYIHPQRNLIVRALGDGPNLEVDVFEHTLQPGDALLMCSDGLWEMVRDPRLCEIVSTAASSQEACRKLIQEANANGGEDNITAIVVFVQ
jgi:serine/threonine protein phosphatase PrpC/ribosomal protein L40E